MECCILLPSTIHQHCLAFLVSFAPSSEPFTPAWDRLLSPFWLSPPIFQMAAQLSLPPSCLPWPHWPAQTPTDSRLSKHSLPFFPRIYHRCSFATLWLQMSCLPTTVHFQRAVLCPVLPTGAQRPAQGLRHSGDSFAKANECVKESPVQQSDLLLGATA